MSRRIGRRGVLLGSLATAACASGAPPARPSVPASTVDAASALAALERRLGGRVGVAAVDTATGGRIAYRAGERFAMCSTFKWLLVAAVLARVDRHELSLDEPIAFGVADLLEYAPVTRAHVAAGRMSIAELCAAAIEVSDNTAANLLLANVGGPAGVTAFARTLGDATTRLDRNEPTLNESSAGDPRDTTTPEAMVATLRATLTGAALTPASRTRLVEAMKRCATGAARLRAGLPRDWIVGDKTGTGAHGAAGDVAITWPPGRAPILIASYLSDSTADLDALNAAHASVGRVVAAAFA